MTTASNLTALSAETQRQKKTKKNKKNKKNKNENYNNSISNEGPSRGIRIKSYKLLASI